jgi:homoserine kinase type II
MFDLAVTVNDWCGDDASGVLDQLRLDALTKAYLARRTPEPAELRAWPMMLRAAALRFWLSRLFDLHLPRAAELVNPKEPEQYARILRHRRHGAPSLQG